MRIAVSPREKWTENGNENEHQHENQYVLMEKVFFRPNDKQNHQTVVMEREKAREKKIGYNTTIMKQVAIMNKRTNYRWNEAENRDCER